MRCRAVHMSAVAVAGPVAHDIASPSAASAGSEGDSTQYNSPNAASTATAEVHKRADLYSQPSSRKSPHPLRMSVLCSSTLYQKVLTLSSKPLSSNVARSSRARSGRTIWWSRRRRGRWAGACAGDPPRAPAGWRRPGTTARPPAGEAPRCRVK